MDSPSSWRKWRAARYYRAVGDDGWSGRPDSARTKVGGHSLAFIRLRSFLIPIAGPSASASSMHAWSSSVSGDRARAGTSGPIAVVA